MLAMRRQARERGEKVLEVPRDTIRVARKKERKLEKIKSFIWE